MTEKGDLEREFHERMLKIYEQAKLECGYRANRFRNMVLEIGGLQTAKQLLGTESYSEGLTRLWEEKRLDISMEATVLQEPWRDLFTKGELAIAKKKLEELGYQSSL